MKRALQGLKWSCLCTVRAAWRSGAMTARDAGVGEASLTDLGRAWSWSSLDSIPGLDLPAPQRDTGVRGWSQLLTTLVYRPLIPSLASRRPQLTLFMLTTLNFIQLFKYVGFLASSPANAVPSAWNILPLCLISSSLSFRSVLKNTPSSRKPSLIPPWL